MDKKNQSKVIVVIAGVLLLIGVVAAVWASGSDPEPARGDEASEAEVAGFKAYDGSYKAPAAPVKTTPVKKPRKVAESGDELPEGFDGSDDEVLVLEEYHPEEPAAVANEDKPDKKLVFDDSARVGLREMVRNRRAHPHQREMLRKLNKDLDRGIGPRLNRAAPFQKASLKGIAPEVREPIDNLPGPLIVE